jgi:hypothetical protein
LQGSWFYLIQRRNERVGMMYFDVQIHINP